MNEEYRSQLIDRFEGFELVELLDISIEDVVEAFYDRIVDSDDLREFMKHGR